jgi:hypothetical protein
MTGDANSDPESWPGGLTGTDGEFMLRASSIMELGTGLHQLAVLAERHVADHDRLAPAQIADSSQSARAIPADVREDLGQRLSDLTAAYTQRLQGQLDQLDPDSVAAQVTDPLEWMAAQLAAPVRESLGEARAAFGDVPADDAALLSYLMQYSQAASRRPLLPVMQRALLITAVDAAERMLTGVLRRIQYDHGGAARWGPPWDSPALDKQIRGLTRGSIDDWIPRLRDDLGVDLPAASCDWAAVSEACARRNVLVHQGGVADQKYADRVPGAASGTPLEVDGTYLRNAIDLLCGFLLGVIFAAWAARPGRRDVVIQLAATYAATAGAESRWPLAENLHALEDRLDEDPEQAAASRVNAWLARMRWRGSGSVLADVTEWAVDNLPQRFALARAILLGQLDEALAMLPGLIAQGEITKDHLRDWPLFGTLRGEPGFRQLLTG